MYRFDTKQDIFCSVVEAKINLERAKQGNESTIEFFDVFKTHVEAFEHFVRPIGHESEVLKSLESTDHDDHPGPMPDVSDTKTTVTQVVTWMKNKENYEQRIKNEARERMLAMMFLQKADKGRYGDLWVSLKNK